MIEPRHWHQARRLWIRARRAVHSPLAGSQRSIFRGSGLTFDEVRPYEPGDDWRLLDWNVTARLGHPFVKRYLEERELPWLLVVDTSRSMDYSTTRQTKREQAAEVAALVCAMALNHQDRIGLVLVSDRIECCLPPRKGSGAALRLLHRLLFHPAADRATHLPPALNLASRLVPRQGLVLVLSDFLLGDGGLPPLELGHRQQVVCVRIRDPREGRWPATGLVQVRDGETGQSRLVDTPIAQDTLRRHRQAEEVAWRAWLARGRAEALDLSTSDDAAEVFLHFARQQLARAKRPRS